MLDSTTLFADRINEGERTLSIVNLPLGEGERVQEVHLQAYGAYFISVRFPVDWSVEIVAPTSGVASLNAEAAHGVAMPFTFSGFTHFAVLEPFANCPLSIKGSVVLYRHDKAGRETERTVELNMDRLLVSGSNQSPDPALASGPPPAGQESRHP
jgi:hypothetical protein